ncbi:MAG: 6-phospho-3-hexuloisomerase [Lachnospiraceae bacterium]
MSVKRYTEIILKELTDNLKYVNDSQLDALVSEILKAKHIFTAGAGRSGVAMKAFTNRLMHLGLSVSSVGEITSPHTKPGDLLIIGSGSGETESLVAMANKAKKNGVKIALVTMDQKSTIAQMADAVAVLPGVSPKLKNAGMEITSVQPMGSAFEQICFLAYDGMIMELMERLNETSDTMFLRHADLE